MSRKPSFEDALRQKMSELPLPDETASWQKMKALLDEKEKRWPFLFFRNEKMWGGALVLCALLLWFALSVQTEKKDTKPVVADKNEIAGKAKKDSVQAQTGMTDEEISLQKNAPHIQPDTVLSSSRISFEAHTSALVNSHFLPEKGSMSSVKKQDALLKKNLLATQLNNKGISDDKAGQTDHPVLQKQDSNITPLNVAKQKESPDFENGAADSSASLNGNHTTTSNSISSIEQTASVKSNSPKADSALADHADAKATIQIRRHRTYFVDAGIGIKQQLPIDSQRFVTYNYNGNQSWFGDYIPFVYVKLEKEKRWFLQGEFHYAAPRLINGVSYRQKTSVDYGHGTATISRYELQKVWYNEVPLSLNIYVRPGWSLGAGVMYSWLRGAAVNKMISDYDASSGMYNDSTGRMPWKGFNDSFLYKNNMSLQLQTDYQINRWSFGIRYLHDIHPYLTYTLPDGQKRNERNASLEMMIRFRFYRSDKFRIGNL